jgi:hypothetical protein
MADGFVAGQAEAADDVSSGADQAFVGSGVQGISEVKQLLATSFQPDRAGTCGRGFSERLRLRANGCCYEFIE